MYSSLDVETKVCLLPTISGVMMVLLCKHIMGMDSSCYKCSPVLSGGLLALGLPSSRILWMVLDLQVMMDTFCKEKNVKTSINCLGVSKQFSKVMVFYRKVLR